ncbi:uncharacterized protein LOC105699759 isoform X2 [Orussus abietinus]|nr:uncharacterized protein LOC105699759 isoform X2 [Orussus abietinus]XP_012280473.1 uncharacterized protein LOC105699759 isoform X2 [Orussus abietinus]XP_012280480.1 uncharacterized protein LOC105699759 isoform X2 [Orussus abietinus]
MGGAHLHTPQSIFQHMMIQQNNAQQTSPWLQVPQVPPLSMPWSIPAFEQPDLIRFTGERSQPHFGPQLHQKRKLDTPDIADIRQTKQFITEEKMAAHFRDLHISPDYQSQVSIPSTSTGRPSYVLPSKTEPFGGLEIGSTNSLGMEDNKDVQPKLVLSDEIRNLQTEPILPMSLLSKLERPSMALVLWEPPSKHLRVLPTPRDTPTPIPDASDDNNNTTTNNNSESIPNLNQASSVEPQSMILEPMDL